MLEDEEAMKAEVEEWDTQKIPSSFKNYKRETSVRDANHIFQESTDSTNLLQKKFQSLTSSWGSKETVKVKKKKERFYETDISEDDGAEMGKYDSEEIVKDKSVKSRTRTSFKAMLGVKSPEEREKQKREKQELHVEQDQEKRRHAGG